MKQRGVIILLLVVALGGFVSIVRAKDMPGDFKEGQWRITVVTKMDKMPAEMEEAMKELNNLPPEARAQMQLVQNSMGAQGMQMNFGNQGMTVTTTQCLTEKNPVPDHTQAQFKERCQSRHQIVGNTVNFQTTCNYEGSQIESTGNMTYSGGSMKGHIKTHQVASAQAMDTTLDMTGEYLGPC